MDRGRRGQRHGCPGGWSRGFPAPSSPLSASHLIKMASREKAARSERGGRCRAAGQEAAGAGLPAPSSSASAASLPCSSSPGRRGPSGHHLTVTAGAGRWDLVAGVKLHMTTAHRENPERVPSPRGPPGCHTPREGDLSPLLPVGSPPGVRPRHSTPEPGFRTIVASPFWGRHVGETCPGNGRLSNENVVQSAFQKPFLLGGA